jgi:hypothetical protein
MDPFEVSQGANSLGVRSYKAPGRGIGHDHSILYRPPGDGALPGLGHPWRFRLRTYRRRDGHLIGALAPRRENAGNGINDVSRYLLPALIGRYCGGEPPTCWLEIHPTADPGERFRLVQYRQYAGGRRGCARWEQIAPDVAVALLEDPSLLDEQAATGHALPLLGATWDAADLWWDEGALLDPRDQRALPPGLYDDPVGTRRWRLTWALARWREAARTHAHSAGDAWAQWHEAAIRAALPALEGARSTAALLDHYFEDRLRAGWLDEQAPTIGDLRDHGAADAPGTVEYWAVRATRATPPPVARRLDAALIVDVTCWRHWQAIFKGRGLACPPPPRTGPPGH